MTSIGRRDRKIEFQRAVRVPDDYGQEQLEWAMLRLEWAAVRWGRGDERREAASTSAPQAATFIVLANSGTKSLQVTDRILFDGSVWDIGGIAELNRGEIEITAVRNASVGEAV